MSIPFFLQPDAMDCGLTCLQMIARHYGRSYTVQTLRNRCNITRSGVSMLGISEAAESIGFRSRGVKVGYDKLSKDAPLPLIAHWNQEHCVVVNAIKNDKVFVADPAHVVNHLRRTRGNDQPDGHFNIINKKFEYVNK